MPIQHPLTDADEDPKKKVPAPTSAGDRRHTVKKFTLVLLGLGLAVAGACTAADTSGKDALPKGSDQFPTEQAGEVKAAETTTTTVAKANTCAVAREAFLTGTPAELEASLKALVADKGADATAREYADYWLNRDKGDAQMQEMDEGLIKMACSV